MNSRTNEASSNEKDGVITKMGDLINWQICTSNWISDAENVLILALQYKQGVVDCEREHFHDGDIEVTSKN
jgi:hypothetical protein